MGEAFDAIREFMEKGGDVLFLVLLVTFIMWVLIIERLWYFRAVYKKDASKVINAWEDRKERKSWHAHKIRIAMISQVSIDLNKNVKLIQTLVAICPLVGLLGTVTGMIEVFDVMAIMGSGNARAMAGGVSKATIPTMAGMVAALSGVFVSTYIERKAKREAEKLEDNLTMDH
ncbi:MAG: MotA/TolQ/ExbB proton channel family protein [Sphingomonadales bacterium]|nr:MotA/TolQ/ExbB proton channel family protein [Sphingomonadales bacterium]